MISKRVYLFLTGGLLLLSIGTGYAMKLQQSPTLVALQALEIANLQLHRAGHEIQNRHQSKAIELVRQAIQEMEAGLASEQMKQTSRQQPAAT
ncbi:MAG: hypothetical protein K0Q50_3019 [Vampirovibrio sp.]|jgi:hypothetical protein|nr:hypothetical protein [Vampirovibrio sp.]